MHSMLYLHGGCSPVANEIGWVLAWSHDDTDFVALVKRAAHDLAAQCARAADDEDGVFGYGVAGDGGVGLRCGSHHAARGDAYCVVTRGHALQ